MSWEVLHTNEYLDWFDGLADEEQDAVLAAVRVLREHGPTLGRPLVEHIEGSSLQKMKELRPMVGGIRILFAFDDERAAILLVGSDKTNQWKKWYRRTIPLAERLYAAHAARLKKGKQQ